MSCRYTITAEAAAGAKARIRTALKLMGFNSIRIEEATIDESSTFKESKPDNLPTSNLAKSVATLFHRQPDKPWADLEIAAFKAAIKGGMDESAMIEVMSFYDRERKKADHYCRTSILTFLRNFGGELDKARADKPRVGKALEWTPANVVPMTDPEQAGRIAEAAREAARKFREGMRR
jgi:hypothetical protein